MHPVSTLDPFPQPVIDNRPENRHEAGNIGAYKTSTLLNEDTFFYRSAAGFVLHGFRTGF
jgi:hypothetical protein